MYVARILYPVEVLGPGKRVGIWFCGCPRRCEGCSNPELWNFQEKYRTTPQSIFNLVMKIAEKEPIDGFTITGGDPMYQATELQQLILLLSKISNDILVYTGYKIEELPQESLQGISVLIDGEYIESKNTDVILRGSSNQVIYILDKRVTQKYIEYCISTKNQIQNFVTPNGTISVGIHRPKFTQDLTQRMEEKGFMRDE